ncbi:MAG: ferrous iron transporter B [Clostridiales bacterium]|nr:ferrous iron transporter B [Clostridiales bacterium]
MAKKLKRDEKLESLVAENPTILLMGSPNVGKSVIFSKLTNVHVNSANYSGTTVSFTKGDYYIGEKKHILIDVPGTYSLEATNDAEKIAVNFLEKKPELVLFVMHAADLQGSIKLLLEILKRDVPVVAALNLVDVARRQGRSFDIEYMEKELGVPIIPTVAVKGEGFDKLERIVAKTVESPDQNREKIDKNLKTEELWARAEKIKNGAVKYSQKDLSKIDKFGDALLKPWPGVLLTVLILIATIGVVVGLGKVLRAILLLPLVNDLIVPFFESLIMPLDIPDILKGVLIGEYGIFRIGFEWIIALVMPYVIIFQLVFTFLEDSGILPRIAVLSDSLMSKIGIQGGSLINIMLGFGCTVPAIIGTRTASTKKERLVVTAALCFSIPCISQIGALITLVGDYSYFMLLLLVLVGLLMFVISSLVTGKLVSGTVSPMIMEIPYLLPPERSSFTRKFLVRVKQFILEAEGPMLIAVVFAALVTETGFMEKVSVLVEPIVSGWLGLPKEASLSLLLGVIRREMSVAPLLALNLSPLQMFVGAVVSLLYIPCLSVMGIIAEEFNARTAIGIFVLTTVNAILVGGLINHMVRLVIV